MATPIWPAMPSSTLPKSNFARGIIRRPSRITTPCSSSIPAETKRRRRSSRKVMRCWSLASAMRAFASCVHSSIVIRAPSKPPRRAIAYDGWSLLPGPASPAHRNRNSGLLARFQLKVAETIGDFRGDFRHSHVFLHQQLAGKRSMLLGAVASVVGNPAILAFLIPAKAPVSDVFGRQKLKTAQQHVVLRDFKLFAENRDLDQPLVGTKKRAGYAMTAHEGAVILSCKVRERNTASHLCIYLDVKTVSETLHGNLCGNGVP